jgi:hypothetical protein
MNNSAVASTPQTFRMCAHINNCLFFNCSHNSRDRAKELSVLTFRYDPLHSAQKYLPVSHYFHHFKILRQWRDSRIHIPAEDMKSLWRKKSKEESQLWHQEEGQVRGRQYFTLVLEKGPNPWFAKCKLNRRAVTSIYRL